MTVFEYDGRLLDRRLRGALPRGEPPRRRPDPPGLRRDPRPPRRDRGGGAHPRPRGPHRRGALPAARARRHPAGRLAADPGARRLQAARAPAAGHVPRTIVAEGDRIDVRALRARVRRGQPLHPRRARGRDPHRRRHWCCTPATSRWTSCRSTAGSPTCAPSRGWGRRASTCSSPTPPTPRSPASPPPSRTIAPGARPGVRAERAAHHRGLLRLPRAPRPAGDGRRGEARPQGRLRRPLDGAQHGHRPRPRLPRRPSRPARRHPRGRRHAAGEGRADLDRLPGRAAERAEPDRAAQPQLRAHRGGRHRRPRLLADPGQRERRLPRDQRPGPLGRPRRAQGQRARPRERARQRRRAALRLQHRQARATCCRCTARSGTCWPTPRWRGPPASPPSAS